MMDKKKLNFDDIVLSEDSTIQGNRWQQDPSGKIQNSRQLTLLDLVRMSEPDKQHPNHIPASETPINGSEMFVELLGDLFLQLDNVEKAIHVVKSSPVLKDRPSSVATIQKMLKKSAFIRKLIISIGEDIDNFSVEKPVR